MPSACVSRTGAVRTARSSSVLATATTVVGVTQALASAALDTTVWIAAWWRISTSSSQTFLLKRLYTTSVSPIAFTANAFSPQLSTLLTWQTRRVITSARANPLGAVRAVTYRSPTVLRIARTRRACACLHANSQLLALLSTVVLATDVATATSKPVIASVTILGMERSAMWPRAPTTAMNMDCVTPTRKHVYASVDGQENNVSRRSGTNSTHVSPIGRAVPCFVLGSLLPPRALAMRHLWNWWNRSMLWLWLCVHCTFVVCVYI